MGWPLGPQYAASSNVDHAGRLTGKLLLVVGELDTNVDPSSTLQVVNALIKSNKNFDLLMATVEIEDFPTCEGMQRGFAAGAQDSIVFGRNEPALQHYHRSIAAALAEPQPRLAAE